MAILAALLAFGSRFASKVLTTALGWATTLLFGRVPASRQMLLLGVAFGSVIWMVLVAGVVFPDVGAFLLVLLPRQEFVPQEVIRLIMLAGALIVPGIIGALTYRLGDRDGSSIRELAGATVRGYPLTVLLAVLLVFLALLSIWRKGWSLARRWTDAHVPLVVEPGAYEEVAADLHRAVLAADLEVTPGAAPATMSRPARWLARVGGRESGSLVPERMLQLKGPGLDILIYPMDLLISGKPALVARARAAMASRLTTSAAHLTVSAEAQAVEDRLTALGTAEGPAGQPPVYDPAAAAEFGEIDQELATILIPYEEWEVLYRQRLQVERNLRANAMAATSATADEPGGRLAGAMDAVRQVIQEGAGAVLTAVADDRTARPIEQATGTAGRLGIAIAAAAVEALTERDKTPSGEDAEPSAEAL